MNYQPTIVLLAFTLLSTMMTSCGSGPAQEESIPKQQKVTSQPFGRTPDGKAVNLYTVRNANGTELSVMNYGGIIVRLVVPDAHGNYGDVVLGYDSLAPYIKDNPFFGALIGRYGNRIAKGRFKLDGKKYELPVNDGPNHLHGGPKGFDKAFWNIEVRPDSSSLLLSYQSADGEQGYPGTLDVKVTYTLTDNNELRINYQAVTDKLTIINLTQHSYFNLTGDATNDILGHQIQIDANQFLPIDSTLIPTGVMKEVKGTPFDFTSLTTISARIADTNQQLKFGKGYDHCWVLNQGDTSLHHAATVVEPKSGRKLDVLTTEPGLQFYSGNFLDGTRTGKKGIAYQKRTALCLESEHFPDSPNNPKFPSVELRPGEKYNTTTVYRFSIVNNQ